MEQGVFSRDFVLTPDHCGMTGRLSPLAVCTLFQAVAAEHAEAIGVGGKAMAQRGEYWLTIHTRVEFCAPAELTDTVTAETWPEECDGRAIRSFRSYRLTRGGVLLARGRTQWAILGADGGLRQFAQSGFPADFPFAVREGITERPARFRDTLGEEDFVYERRVRATDIDLGHHMNNVAYVRALLDAFPAARLADGSLASLEVHYAAACLEGEVLRVYAREENGLWSMAVRKADGRAAVLAEVRFRQHSSEEK